MARQVLFIQGFGAGTHDEWDNHLVASLQRHLGEGYVVRYPRMPGEDDPQYRAWKTALLQELDSLQELSIVVGHSGGGATLLHTLADEQRNYRLSGIFLVAAPFFGEGGWPSEDIAPRPDLTE